VSLWWLFLVSPTFPYASCGKASRERYPHFRIPLSFFVPMSLFLFFIKSKELGLDHLLEKIDSGGSSYGLLVASVGFLVLFLFPVWIYRGYEKEFHDQRDSIWQRYLRLIESQEKPKLVLRPAAILGICVGVFLLSGLTFVIFLSLGFDANRFSLVSALVLWLLIYVIKIFREYLDLRSGRLLKATIKLEHSKLSPTLNKLTFSFDKNSREPISLRGLLYANRRNSPCYFVGEKITPTSLLLEDALMRWVLLN
jgi:hypothetical protein